MQTGPDENRYGEELRNQAATWKRKKSIRVLYTYWFEQIAALLSPWRPLVELGCGCGAFRDYLQERGENIVATDALCTDWCDLVVDARRLPFKDQTVGNLLLVDVLHHVENPLVALAEFQRVLKPGGRVILLEPYVSKLFGRIVYGLLHHEPMDLGYDVVSPPAYTGPRGAFANDAIPTLIFEHHVPALARLAPELEMVKMVRMTGLSYPLMGGFNYPNLLPSFLARPLGMIEDAVMRTMLGSVFALRMLVVLERIEKRKEGGD